MKHKKAISSPSPEVIRALIEAVAAYGLEVCWTDTDIHDTLAEMGISDEDYFACGKGDFIKAYQAERIG